jgi:hypothetical protein
VTKDWFRVTLSTTNAYDFLLKPDNTAPGGGPDLKLSVYDANGVLVAEYDSGGMGGAEQKADFVPPSDGVYYVAVSQFTPGDVGTYTLTAQINRDGPPANGNDSPLSSIDWAAPRIGSTRTASRTAPARMSSSTISPGRARSTTPASARLRRLSSRSSPKKARESPSSSTRT